MAVVKPFNFILFAFASIWACNFLLCIVVLEMSKSDSTNDLLPECLFPSIINGLFSNLF